MRAILLMSFLSILLVPSAYAYPFCNSSTGVSILTESTTAGGTAHLIDADTTDCASLCSVGVGGARRGYIEFADKELYALALSIAMIPSPRGNVVITWDPNAPLKGSLFNGTTTCKIIGLSR